MYKFIDGFYKFTILVGVYLILAGMVYGYVQINNKIETVTVQVAEAKATINDMKTKAMEYSSAKVEQLEKTTAELQGQVNNLSGQVKETFKNFIPNSFKKE